MYSYLLQVTKDSQNLTLTLQKSKTNICSRFFFSVKTDFQKRIRLFYAVYQSNFLHDNKVF